MTVQLLADRAAAAALTQPNLSAGQWIYQVLEWRTPEPRRAGRPNPSVQSGWMTANGRITYGGPASSATPSSPITRSTRCRATRPGSSRTSATWTRLKPTTTASWSSARSKACCSGWCCRPGWRRRCPRFALIPMIQVKDHITDIASRAGIAFVMPETGQSEKEEIILDASDYHLLAHATWDNPPHPRRTPRPRYQERPVAQLGTPSRQLPAERGQAGGSEDRLLPAVPVLHAQDQLHHTRPVAVPGAAYRRQGAADLGDRRQLGTGRVRKQYPDRVPADGPLCRLRAVADAGRPQLHPDLPAVPAPDPG